MAFPSLRPENGVHGGYSWEVDFWGYDEELQKRFGSQSGVER